MIQKFHKTVGIVAVIVTGYTLHEIQLMTAKQNIDLQRATEKYGKCSRLNPNAKSKDIVMIEKMLQDLPSKSFKDKIESAYDGAVSAHEIGFTSSVSKKPAARISGREID